MGAGYRYQHDLVERLQQPHAVDHAGAKDVEATQGLVHHGLDGFFGHAGVMLQLHRGHSIALVAVTHRAYEAAHRAHALVFAAQGGDLKGQVKVLGLDGNAGQGHGKKRLQGE